jgi:hypothetical protein
MTWAATQMDQNQPRDEVIILLEKWKYQLAEFKKKNLGKPFYFRNEFISLNVPDGLHKYSGTMGLTIAIMVDNKPSVASLQAGHLIIFLKDTEEATNRINQVEQNYFKQDNFCQRGVEDRLVYYLDSQGNYVAYPTNVDWMSTVCRFEGSIVYRNCKLTFQRVDSRYNDFVNNDHRSSYYVESDGKTLNKFRYKQLAYEAMISNVACSGSFTMDPAVKAIEDEFIKKHSQ